MSETVDSLVADGQRQEFAALSEAYRDATLTSDQVTEAAELITTAPAADQYLLLLALRRDAPEVYDSLPADVRAKVLAGTLASMKYVNDFGYLDPGGSYDDELGRALVELGEPAARALRPLLDDDRKVRLEDSEAATLSKRYDYRRADFAYRYASLALGRDPVFHRDKAQRDADISELRSELDNQPA